jgi:hypothetical protein
LDPVLDVDGSVREQRVARRGSLRLVGGVDLHDVTPSTDGLLIVSQVRLLDAEQHGQAMQQASQRPTLYRDGRGYHLAVGCLPTRVTCTADSSKRGLDGRRGGLGDFRSVEERDDGVFHEPPPFDGPVSAGAAKPQSYVHTIHGALYLECRPARQ